MRQYWGEIKDPVHGYVYITEAEKQLIDSYPVQRLRRLRQLAGSEFVYSGAMLKLNPVCFSKNPISRQLFGDENAAILLRSQ